MKITNPIRFCLLLAAAFTFGCNPPAATPEEETSASSSKEDDEDEAESEENSKESESEESNSEDETTPSPTGSLALGAGFNATVAKDLAVSSVTETQSQETIVAGQLSIAALVGLGLNQTFSEEQCTNCAAGGIWENDASKCPIEIFEPGACGEDSGPPPPGPGDEGGDGEEMTSGPDGPGPGPGPGTNSGPTGNDYYSKTQRMKGVLTATNKSDCLGAMPSEFGFAQGNFGHAKCNGPSGTYSSHPNEGGNFEFGAGDLGMFWDYAEPKADNSGPTEGESDEACGARVTNNLVNNVSKYADAAIGFNGLIACVARIDELQLPEVDKTVDVTNSLGSLDTSRQDFAITSAKVKRLPDNGNGFPVYQTEVTGSLTDVPREMTRDFKLTISHSPENEGNSKYSGKIQFKILEFNKHEVGSTAQKLEDSLISIKYSWGDKNLRYRYRQLGVDAASSEANGFDIVTGEVAKPESGNTWTEVVVNQDHLGFGSIAFSWAPGSDSANVFNAFTKSVEDPNDPTKKIGVGAAYFGKVPNPATKIGTDEFYTIEGFKCFGFASQGTLDPYVQKQVLKLDTSTGTWALEKDDSGNPKSYIRYQPVSGCDAGTPSSGEAFTVGLETSSGKQNVDLTLPITNGLYSFSNYQSEWTVPLLPWE